MYSTRRTSGSHPLIPPDPALSPPASVLSPPASVLPPPASVLVPPDSPFLHRRIPDSRFIVAPRAPHITIQFLQGKGSLDLFSLDLPLPVGFAGDRPQDGTSRTPPPNDLPQDGLQHDPDNPFIDFPHDVYSADTVDPQVSRHRRKREKQWERWQQEVIPRLIRPYMTLMCATKSLREPIPASPPCCCAAPGRNLEVILVRFDSLERVVITICNCAPAAAQLVQRGFFPSAPLAPTLAVDMKVLDFVASLFVNIAPNNTAWCKTVETFLSKQGYKLTTEDSLRKRFGNALHWYNILQDETTLYVDHILSVMRRTELELEDGIDISHPVTSVASSPSVPNLRTPEADRGAPDEAVEHEILPAAFHVEPNVDSVTPTAPRRQGRPRVEEVDDDGPHSPRAQQESADDFEEQSTPGPSTARGGMAHGARGRGSKRPRGTPEETQPSNPFPDPRPRARPSDYLRSRCPLCFGGKFSPVRNGSQPHAIVCEDACFTQKRNHQARDPPHTHPRTVFVDERDAARMEDYVDSVRPSKTRKTKRSRNEPQDEEDGYEGSLRIPKSVLDGCESSFTAADGRREKASTQFFDDTALMALVCRHDIVLFLVNMRSAGEKQHYAIVLLETLFQHLPTWFTIGVLYDIGCQLERSCVKWGFLDRYLDRIIFGISVFHAFGHQWPCQIIYHPRKREGFGLTDGEGCERVWHSISKLIAYLRVCGYHQRLYTLDRQVNHAQAETLERFGLWLLRRSRHAARKREAAEAILLECGQSEGFLRAQWAAQVRAQTKPLPRKYYILLSSLSFPLPVFISPLPPRSTACEGPGVAPGVLPLFLPSFLFRLPSILFPPPFLIKFPFPTILLVAKNSDRIAIGRSKTKGQEVVEQVIRLRKARDILRDRIQDFEHILLDADSAPDIFADAEMGLRRARETLSDTNTRIRAKEAALGVRARQELLTLVNSPFIAARMNARALKVL
ncbi:hypothetical protein LshimejAT787_0112520 [Lyophyllum shimeji]|uniref:CxC1-like cysteine cluster associated with KDZ transposases domain-containing protein n=1 Tax=Lyophyllum shimeji TaxID=47721 RepID=A0A9P3PFA1_LYOSH|nr:hypothetical protein LshimejAT787_0112520 [Lyophyllum shimeji]